MLVGNDISNAQGQIDWATYSKNSNFVIMKTSEGSSFIDPWFGYNRQQARLNNIPRGFYAFARPDLGNTPQAEAQLFCNLLDGDPIQEGEVLALDFEVEYHDAVNWCKQWLDTVSTHFNGTKPLIYLNQNLASTLDWTPIVQAGYGLWIASYTGDPTNNTANTGSWPFAAIQQWTNVQQVPGITGNVDGDVFFGDAVAFYKYGYHKPVVVNPAPTIIIPPVTPTDINNLIQTATTLSAPGITTTTSTAVTPPVTPQGSKNVLQLLEAIIRWLKSI